MLSKTTQSPGSIKSAGSLGILRAPACALGMGLFLKICIVLPLSWLVTVSAPIVKRASFVHPPFYVLVSHGAETR
jgi:hypothetical protein